MKTKIGIFSRTLPADHRRVTEVARLVEQAGGVAVTDGLSQADVVLVLGGDGTILRAADIVRDTNIPVIGVNFGHVGFLAEADPESLHDGVNRLVRGEYEVEERLALQACVTHPDGHTETGWALNECAIDKVERSGMIDVSIGIDGEPISSFSCDGVVISTPTGSTAYAFSGGGPVVWPDVEAIVIVPIAAHALFSRPMVIAPGADISVHLDETGTSPAEIWCDGSRMLAAPVGSSLTITRTQQPVRLARLWNSPFAGRLVAKLRLPVRNWKHRGDQ